MNQRDRFFAGEFDRVRVVPMTPFPETSTTVTDPFEEMFGKGVFTMGSSDLLECARMNKWFRQGDVNKLRDVPYPTNADGHELPHGSVLNFNKTPIRYP